MIDNLSSNAISVMTVICILVHTYGKKIKIGKILDKTRESQSAGDFSARSKPTRITFYGLNLTIERPRLKALGLGSGRGHKRAPEKQT